VSSDKVKRKARTGIAVWDEVEIPQRRCAVWRFAPRSIWVERVDNEWHALSTPYGGSGAEAAFVERTQKPTSSQWRHYLHTENAPVQPAPVARPSHVHDEYGRRSAAPQRPTQPALDLHGRPANQRSFEDDQLEIPAFLRRQSN